LTTNEADKLRKSIKNKEYMKEYRKRKKSDLNDPVCKMEIVNNQATCEAVAEFIEKRTKHCSVASEDKYLSLLGAKIKRMDNFTIRSGQQLI